MGAKSEREGEDEDVEKENLNLFIQAHIERGRSISLTQENEIAMMNSKIEEAMSICWQLIVGGSSERARRICSFPEDLLIYMVQAKEVDIWVQTPVYVCIMYVCNLCMFVFIYVHTYVCVCM